MADQELFNPLDSLGPEYGRINQPIPDAKGLSAFEGDLIDMPKFKDTAKNESYYPSVPNVENLNRPNRQITNNHVKTNAVNPSIPKKPLDINQYNQTNKQFLLCNFHYEMRKLVIFSSHSIKVTSTSVTDE